MWRGLRICWLIENAVVERDEELEKGECGVDARWGFGKDEE